MEYVFLGVFALCAVAFLVRLLRNVFAPVRKVSAVVVHKQTVELFSKYDGSGKRTKYSVTFLVGDQRLSFYVSAFSYDGYRKGEKGTLTYKGDRLIDFH